MNKVIKSLLLAAAFMVPAQKVSAFNPADCDVIARMGFGVLLGAGFYQSIEEAMFRLWDSQSGAAQVPHNYVLREQSEDVYGNKVIVDLAPSKKTLTQKLLKLAKNCGKTALVLALGYALVYNSFADLILTGMYDVFKADFQAGLFKTNSYKNPSLVVVPRGATGMNISSGTNIVLS